MTVRIAATVLLLAAAVVSAAESPKYRDGRPAATLRMDAKDHGVVLRYGDGPDKCDILGARDVWVFEAGGTYYMHYDAAGPKGWLSSLAVSKDLITWKKKGPILDLGKPGEDDSKSAAYGVTYYDGKQWHMFYLGTPNVTAPPNLIPGFPYLTMKAKSKTPAGPWIKQKTVIPFRTKPNTYYSITASPGQVVKNGDEYLQFFSSTTRKPGNPCVQRTLGTARTKNLDGPWTVDPKPVVPIEEQIENSALHYEKTNKTWFLFTNHIGIGRGEYTDAIWVYWSKDLNKWDPKNKAVVLDGKNCTWSKKCIGLPSVVQVGKRLALFYDAPGGASISHMKRHVGLAWLDLPLKPPAKKAEKPAENPVALNGKDDGYRGIWYMNQPLKSVYKYKYSGGLGTYCAKHKPFAVYCAKVRKTFFCYGGTTKTSNGKLMHMVSYYDHEKKVVPRPTILLDKKTDDAHDNPVISVDDKGYIWIFSTSHGTGRPSYIHRSEKPYDIDAFEMVSATRLKDGKKVPIENFSYFQAWRMADKGFVCFFTKYNWGAARALAFMTSPDGVEWSQWRRLACMGKGHYQISAATGTKAASAFNYHPIKGGLNYRTNLYYIETPDLGKTWRTVDGKPLKLPLTSAKTPAMVRDYEKDGLKVYLKDIRFDKQDRPFILYITSKGFESGPKNDPRTWTLAHWDGDKWRISEITTSDNNYDMGSLYIEDDAWRVIGPTQTGPQAYNPGGEIALWESKDRGKSWKMLKQMTAGGTRNHTYARAPVNAHPDFYALWADGHGRQPSKSNLYFCNRAGDVYALPRQMSGPFARPALIEPDAPADADKPHR